MMKKTMINLLALAMTVVVMTSCSEDDSTESGQDPIIGTWFFAEEVEIVNGQTEVIELSDCDQMENLVFGTEGSYTVNGFSNFGTNDMPTCETDEPENGSWNNLGDNNYEITVDGISNTVEILFSDNNNRFTVEEMSNGDGVTVIFRCTYERR